MENVKITSEQLRKKLDEGAEVLILDVRDEEKYQAGSLIYKGVEVKNLPYISMIENHDLDQLPEGAEIVTVCTTGNKAQKAAAFLCEKGYKAVSVEGGLTAWREDVAK